jgi:hypothetical protein
MMPCNLVRKKFQQHTWPKYLASYSRWLWSWYTMHLKPQIIQKKCTQSDVLICGKIRINQAYTKIYQCSCWLYAIYHTALCRRIPLQLCWEHNTHYKHGKSSCQSQQPFATYFSLCIRSH